MPIIGRRSNSANEPTFPTNWGPPEALQRRLLRLPGNGSCHRCLPCRASCPSAHVRRRSEPSTRRTVERPPGSATRSSRSIGRASCGPTDSLDPARPTNHGLSGRDNSHRWSDRRLGVPTGDPPGPDPLQPRCLIGRHRCYRLLARYDCRGVRKTEVTH